MVTPSAASSVGEHRTGNAEGNRVTRRSCPANKASYATGLGTPAQLLRWSLVAWTCSIVFCPRLSPATDKLTTKKRAPSAQGRVQQTDSGPSREEGGECSLPHFTRAYLRHLLKSAGKILGCAWVSVHNSHMFMKVMAGTPRPRWAAGAVATFRRESSPITFPSRKLRPGREKYRSGRCIKRLFFTNNLSDAVYNRAGNSVPQRPDIAVAKETRQPKAELFLDHLRVWLGTPKSPWAAPVANAQHPPYTVAPASFRARAATPPCLPCRC